MRCNLCGGEAHDSWFGPWCDACGGTAVGKRFLDVRHVATVVGDNGKYDIVWDRSAMDYVVAYPRLLDPALTDLLPQRPTIDSLGEFRKLAIIKKAGKLVDVIALAKRVARTDGGAEPAVSASAHATSDELKLIGA